MRNVPALDYRRFGISRERGFLPQSDPRVSGNLEAWMRIYSYAAARRIFKEGSNVLPASIAVPLVETAKALGRPPCLSYASYCLNNFRRVDKNRGVELDNLRLITRFTDSPNERGFIIIHTEIERKAGKALAEFGVVQSDVLDNDRHQIEAGLKRIRSSLMDVLFTLAKMPAYCSPAMYHLEVRPYIFSFVNIVYEGVAEYEGPQSFRGETGAQSSILPALDAFFGITFKHSFLTDYLEEIKAYMPVGHREFIGAVRQGPSLRDFIIGSKSELLRLAYNECVELMTEFRDMHYKYAREYIASKVFNPLGTGGTIFVEFLRDLRDETWNHMLAH